MKNPALLVSLCVVGIGLSGLGVASAMSGRPSSNMHADSDRHQCFDSNFIDSFQTPDDHTLVIVSDDNQAYELKLGGVCMGLDTSFAIGVKARNGMSQICGPFDADIVYRDGFRHQECPVTSVRHLTGDEAAKYVRAPRHSAGQSTASPSAKGW